MALLKKSKISASVLGSEFRIFFPIFLLIFIALLPHAGFAQGQVNSTVPKSTLKEGIELSGPVTKVVDGDTLDVNNVRVRLALVDTPERGQDGYQSAKDFVKKLCIGNNAEVDIDDGQRGGDRYSREIGVVYCNGVNVNSELLKKGYAITYRDYCDVSEFANDGWANCNATNSNANQSDFKAMNKITKNKQGNCDPSYRDVCIPSPPPDLDCSDISDRDFKVIGSDPHRFDVNNDGIGCESNEK